MWASNISSHKDNFFYLCFTICLRFLQDVDPGKTEHVVNDSNDVEHCKENVIHSVHTLPSERQVAHEPQTLLYTDRISSKYSTDINGFNNLQAIQKTCHS